MKIPKKIAILLLFIIFNYNCTPMNTKTCFNIDTFSMISKLIEEKGKTVMLYERLIASEDEKAKEISFENYVLELVVYDTTSRIVVIDTQKNIPSYFCEIIEDELYFSAYESRIDSEQDMKDRRANWCMLTTKILAK